MINNRIFDFRDNYSCRKAFSLAETLITLGVIGILAAILIPAVTSVSPNQNKVMLKKAYAIIEQTVAKMVNDDTNYPADQLATVGGYVYPLGFSYTTATINGTKNKFCYFFTDNLTTIGNITCPNADAAVANRNGILIATTSDGMTWYISLDNTVGTDAQRFVVADPTNTYRTRIIVDVNGVSNGPNCSDDLWLSNFIPSGYSTTSCSKPDTFIFGIRYDGKIRAANCHTAQTDPETVTDAFAQSVLSSPTDIK